MGLMDYDFEGLEVTSKGDWRMTVDGYLHSDLTGEIIGCVMAVHSALGPGFQEVFYQRALSMEMDERGIAFGREVEMPVFYRDRQIGTRRVDFLVDEVVAVELKAVGQLNDVHLAQAINYVEAYKLEVGLLINFGGNRLEFRRLINSRLRGDRSGGDMKRRRT